MGVRPGAVARRLGINAGSPIYASARERWNHFSLLRGRRSYSQCGEDLLVAHFAPPFETGTYVDVGSGHPVIGSNTYLFYRQGWSGLLIDPLEGNVRESRRRRPRDKVIRAAVGASDEPQTLYEFDPYELTTTSVERVRQLEGQGFRPIRETSTPQVRLRDLGLEARPRDPVVLSIDVEGVEVEVLTGNDWSRFRPRVICIEELRRPERELSSTATVLQSEGYILKATAVWTSVFVHADVL